MTDKRRLIAVFLIALAGLAVYANSLKGDFIYDDEFLVKNNPLLTGWNKFPLIFKSAVPGGVEKIFHFYRPVQLASYLVDHSFWKMDTLGYHITNVLIHILAAVILFWFVNILFGNIFLSFLTAIFFVVHPVHTGAVSYISGRSDPLSLIFQLLCMIFYIKKPFKNTALSFLAVAAAYCLALLSKESAFIVPVLLLVYHYTFKKKVDIPLFSTITVISIIYLLLRVTALKFLLVGASYPTTLIQRLPGFLVAVTSYLRLLLVPVNLHMEYTARLFTFTDPKAIMGAIIILGVCAYIFIRRDKNKLALFSILWFFLALLPFSNLYAINAYMAEHWLYVPSIGYFLILANLFTWLAGKSRFKWIALALTVIIISAYSYLTIKQNAYWKDNINFYKMTLKYFPYNHKMLNNLGNEYHSRRMYDEAIIYHRRSIEANPEQGETYYNLANDYFAIGRLDDALVCYKKSVEVTPDLAEGYNNIASMYINWGNAKEAIAFAKKAIELRPNFATAHANLAVAYYREKEYDLAIQHCDKAIELGVNVHPELLMLLKPYRK